MNTPLSSPLHRLRPVLVPLVGATLVLGLEPRDVLRLARKEWLTWIFDVSSGDPRGRWHPKEWRFWLAELLAVTGVAWLARSDLPFPPLKMDGPLHRLSPREAISRIIGCQELCLSTRRVGHTLLVDPTTIMRLRQAGHLRSIGSGRSIKILRASLAGFLETRLVRVQPRFTPEFERHLQNAFLDEPDDEAAGLAA
jgi:hypothetical protein